MRMTVLFDDTEAAAAKNALDTLRDLDRKLRDERRRHSDHSLKYTAILSEWDAMATELADAVLVAATYWSDQPDALLVRGDDDAG